MLADATTQGASDFTSAKGAAAQIPLSTASGVTQHNRYHHDQEPNSSRPFSRTSAYLPRVVTRLRRAAWVEGLADHPDQNFANKLIEYIDNGVPLLYEGPDLNQNFPNWKSCVELKAEVETSMLYDIRKQWKVGPFASQPFDLFVGSPMGAFLKPLNTGLQKFVLYTTCHGRLTGRSTILYLTHCAL
jgi:hypothetical protein